MANSVSENWQRRVAQTRGASAMPSEWILQGLSLICVPSMPVGFLGNVAVVLVFFRRLKQLLFGVSAGPW
jgi:hypothetical protein